jgi:hypothetical protein
MRNLLYVLIVVLASACNLTTPAAPVEIASPTSAGIQVSPDVTMPPDGGWVTYTNTQEGYALNHLNWMPVTERSGPDDVLIGDYISVRVSDFNPEEARGDGPLIEEATDTMVIDLPARRLKGTIGAVGGNIPHTIEQLVIPHNGRFYIFEVSELSNTAPYDPNAADHTPGPIPTEAKALFEEIVLTVRFLDEE